MASARCRLVLVGVACVSVHAIDMKWTPNGEGPAPFSTKARQQMGIDPQSFAQAPNIKSVTTRMGLASLAVMYVTNNWCIVLALRDWLTRLFEPIFRAMRAQKEQKERLATAKAAEAARTNRVNRLRSEKKR